jgi:DNA-binding GntR family transcriptional regulator
MADDVREGDPPYLRVAADLRAGILDGTYPPGSALPSINRIAQEWGVAKSTAAKALAVLKEEGLARGIHGWGTMVTQR